jgi:hypothetical protein
MTILWIPAVAVMAIWAAVLLWRDARELPKKGEPR